MQAIKHNNIITRNWVVVGSTMSQSSTWGFDRIRLYYPTDYTEVACFSLDEYNNNFAYLDNRSVISQNATPTYGSYRFSTTNDFEHDFSFDLSSSPTNEQTIIAIRGIQSTAEFQQIYAWPTGYSASFGRNADLYEWDFSRINPGVTVGGVATSIIMRDNPNLAILRWTDHTIPKKLVAASMQFQNCNLNDSMVTNLLDWTDAGGVSNGTLDYSGNPGTPFERCWEQWNNLIGKGWTITGNQPSGTNPQA